MNAHQLAEVICDELKKLGHSAATINTEYDRVYAIAIDIFRSGSATITEEEIHKFLVRTEDRVLRGEISFAFQRHLRLSAQRVLEILKTGKLVWQHRLRGSRRYPISEGDQTLIAAFSDAKARAISSKQGIDSALRRHLFWVAKRKMAIADISIDDMRDYILSSLTVMQKSSLKTDLAYLRQFYRFLHDNGLRATSVDSILSLRIPDERKIKVPISQDEIGAVLKSIDRTTNVGKRDYAIILLAVMTGIRGCDIITLKLSDIDWKNGEIRIMQSKTSNPLTLPLTKDLGVALQDYILNVRPQSDSENVFLRMLSPYKGLVSSGAINELYKKWFTQAGLAHLSRDKRTFHSLRRSLGMNMVLSGVPVTTVAQVLGHNEINSTKQYISLDSNHLKECALSFAGIEPRRRA